MITNYSRYVFGPGYLPDIYTFSDFNQNYGGGYDNCDRCNYWEHFCYNCGIALNHNGTEYAEYGPERLHDCEESDG